MTEGILAFIIWSVVGVLIICCGIIAARAKKPVGFWANAKAAEVTDIKSYNKAVARLLCLFGVVEIILGLPLLAGQNSAWILLSAGGVVVESIAAMAIYTLVIEKKYKKH